LQAAEDNIRRLKVDIDLQKELFSTVVQRLKELNLASASDTGI
jgi:hypothetical protein